VLQKWIQSVLSGYGAPKVGWCDMGAPKVQSKKLQEAEVGAPKVDSWGRG